MSRVFYFVLDGKLLPAFGVIYFLDDAFAFANDCKAREEGQCVAGDVKRRRRESYRSFVGALRIRRDRLVRPTPCKT